MEKSYINLNIVNVITITIAALLGYAVLVGSTMVLKRVKPDIVQEGP